MGQIQGLAAHAAGAELLPFRYDPGELGIHEVEIGITHCGICHSDIHLISNDWGMSQYPFIPGHEIIGTVTAIGAQVRSLKTGSAGGSGLAIELVRRSASGAPAVWRISAPQAEATCVHRHGGYADRVYAPTPGLWCRFLMPCLANRLRRCYAAESLSITRCVITESIRRRGWEW